MVGSVEWEYGEFEVGVDSLERYLKWPVGGSEGRRLGLRTMKGGLSVA